MLNLLIFSNPSINELLPEPMDTRILFMVSPTRPVIAPATALSPL